MSQNSWFTYMLKCADGSLYTGICKNLKQRIAQHNCGQGAKYTRGRTPVKLVYQQPQPNRSVATKEELRIKKLSRKKKLALIASAEHKSN